MNAMYFIKLAIAGYLYAHNMEDESVKVFEVTPENSDLLLQQIRNGAQIMHRYNHKGDETELFLY